MTISVFLLDDHEVVRRGIRELLESEDDIEVVGEAGTAAGGDGPHPGAAPRRRGARRAAARRQRRRRCAATSARRMPRPACLMLTSYADDEALFDAIMAGASGYVLKQIRGADLVDAVRAVAAGQLAARPGGDRARDGAAARPAPATGRPRWPRLTDAGARILELIGEGLTNRQIGERMFLAEKTVKNYVSSLLAKLGIERRTQAAVLRHASCDSTRGPRLTQIASAERRPASSAACRRRARRTSRSSHHRSRAPGRRGCAARCAATVGSMPTPSSTTSSQQLVAPLHATFTSARHWRGARRCDAPRAPRRAACAPTAAGTSVSTAPQSGPTATARSPAPLCEPRVSRRAAQAVASSAPWCAARRWRYGSPGRSRRARRPPAGRVRCGSGIGAAPQHALQPCRWRTAAGSPGRAGRARSGRGRRRRRAARRARFCPPARSASVACSANDDQQRRPRRAEGARPACGSATSSPITISCECTSGTATVGPYGGADTDARPADRPAIPQRRRPAR